jgi:CO/xanthine dehydrogenase Mo-binding subunit
MGYVGSRMRRLEDPRLLAGVGHFADDEQRPGQLWMRVVRSPVAHAVLGAVDVGDALKLSGVRTVLTDADISVPPIPVRVSPDPIGGALFEELAYSPEGQPVAASLIDYLLPSAREAPEVVTLVTEDHPSASNPLGAKGAGEGGITTAGAAIANAVSDAVGTPGEPTRLPITPERVCQLIVASSGVSAARQAVRPG